MKKIIFLDIDGTLRDFDGMIPVSAVKAIHQAQKNGHKVCLSTGRPYPRIEKDILDIGFDGVVASSGSYVEYEGECVSHCVFSIKLYMEFIVWLLQRNCIVEIENHRHTYLLRDDWERYASMTGIGREAPLCPLLIDKVTEVDQADKMVVFCQKELREELRGKWENVFHIVELSAPYSSGWAAEITPLDVSKAKGIQAVLKASGFAREDVIGIGDSTNDLEMLDLAEQGIAMGNAPENVKQKADYVTDSVKEDGIWKAFEHEKLL